VQAFFFRKKMDYMQKTFQPELCPLTGRKRATVKAFTRGEVPFVANAKEAIAAERHWPILSEPLMRVHGVSRARFGLRFGHRV